MLGRAGPSRTDASDDSERAGEALGREISSHTKRIWPIGPPLETHPYRRCKGIPVRGLGGGKRLRRRLGRRSPETADGDLTRRQGPQLIFIQPVEIAWGPVVGQVGRWRQCSHAQSAAGAQGEVWRHSMSSSTRWIWSKRCTSRLWDKQNSQQQISKRFIP